MRADATPHLTVVWYELHGDLVLINTRIGRGKERNIARERRVSLCVEDGYRAVTIDGCVVREEQDVAAARADILRLGIRYDGEAEARRQYEEIWSRQLRTSYYVSIEHVHAIGFDS